MAELHLPLTEAPVLNIDLSDQKSLQEFLARRHPHYAENESHWRFCELTYKGGREWFRDGNIHKYLKEGDTEYDQRVARAYRPNHTREVTDLVVKYLFKSDVERNVDDVPDYVKKFWRRSTRNGLNIKEFMKIVATKSAISGRIWVIVDSTKSANVVTLADEKASKARCYAYVVSPLDVLDLAFDDDDGELSWMLIQEHVRDDKNPIKASGNVKLQYRLWLRDSWYLFELRDNSKATADDTSATPAIANALQSEPWASTDLGGQTMLPGLFPYLRSGTSNSVEVVLVDHGVNPIGIVPAIPVDNVTGDYKYSAPALIADVAYLDKAIANYLSNLDAVIQDQTFSQLAMPAQNILPGDDKYEAVRDMGTKRVFLFDGEGGGQPFYLSPDPSQAALIVDIINKLINEIYSSIGVAGERTKQDNAVGIDNSSGVAKAYDFERLNSLLVSKSEACENAEKAIIRLLALWNNDPSILDPDEETIVEKDTAIVKYADTFDTRSLYDEFTVAERLSIIDAPRTIRQEQMRQLADKLFPTLKQDLKDQMETDLDTWPITGLDQVAIQGVASGNPSATFPAKLTSSAQPGMKPMPQPAQAAGPGAKKPAASKPGAKNPKTQNKQGQNNKG